MMTTRRGDKAARQRARRFRWIILGAVLLAMTTLAAAHQHIPEMSRWAGTGALCPFGGLETLYSLVSGDGFIKRTAVSSVILLVGMLAMALIYRRSFCGTICPLGALQGIFGAAGRTFFKRRFTMPASIDRPARYLKYAVLLIFILWTWQAAELVFRPYDPWCAWTHLTTSELLTAHTVGLGVLILALVGSFFYDRFFCKYLCPAGALLALFSRASVLTIERSASACTTACHRCETACPMNVAITEMERVTSPECISCNECVNACPVPGALTVAAPGRTKLPAVVATGIVAAVMIGIVTLTTLSGAFDWQKSSNGGGKGRYGSSTAAESHGGQSASESGDGRQTIRGSTSPADIAASTGIPLSAFTAEWGIASDDLEQPLGQIKVKYGFTPEDIRLWVEEQVRQR